MSEKLTLIPAQNYEWFGDHSLSLMIGNSGLEFVHFKYDPESIYMHFTPDNNCGYEIDEATAIKYSKIYCAAFYQFLLSWNDEENFLIQPRPRFVVGSTNGRMFRFREHLFNQEGYIFEMINSLGDSYEYRLDMEKVVRNQQLLERLKRIHDRCRKEDYFMDG